MNATNGGNSAAAAMSSANTTAAAGHVSGAGSTPQAKPKIIVDFNFSSLNNSHVIIIAMTDEVDSKVVIFDWTLARVNACAEWKRVHIDRVTFNPADEAREICVSGHNIWALYTIKNEIKDGILNPTNKNFCEMITKARRHILSSSNQKTIITEHCWIDRERLIGCTMTGEMYYLVDKAIHKIYDNAFQSEENQSYVVSITKFSKGFFVGSNEGEMAMWIRSEENQSSSGKSHYDFKQRW